MWVWETRYTSLVTVGQASGGWYGLAKRVSQRLAWLLLASCADRDAEFGRQNGSHNESHEWMSRCIVRERKSKLVSPTLTNTRPRDAPLLSPFAKSHTSRPDAVSNPKVPNPAMTALLYPTHVISLLSKATLIVHSKPILTLSPIPQPSTPRGLVTSPCPSSSPFLRVPGADAVLTPLPLLSELLLLSGPGLDTPVLLTLELSFSLLLSEVRDCLLFRLAVSALLCSGLVTEGPEMDVAGVKRDGRLLFWVGVGEGVISVEGETSTSSASRYHLRRRV